MTTHVKAVWLPSRSWMMTGSDVETTVEASIDTNMPRMRPERASSTWRWFMRGFTVPSEDMADMGVLRGWGDTTVAALPIGNG